MKSLKPLSVDDYQIAHTTDSKAMLNALNDRLERIARKIATVEGKFPTQTTVSTLLDESLSEAQIKQITKIVGGGSSIVVGGGGYPAALGHARI